MSRAERLVEAALAKDRAGVEKCLAPAWFGLMKPVPVNEHHQGLGLTALMAAARAGDTTLVEFLIDRGADIQAQSVAGQLAPAGSTALHQAAMEKQTQMVDLLLDKGADPDGKDADGWTPLQLSRKAGDRKSVALLLKRGANAFRGSPKGTDTTLRWMLKQGDAELIASFIAHTPNLTATDKKGNTALTIALEEGNLDIAVQLLEACVRHQTGIGKDSVGEASLSRLLGAAVERGRMDVVRTLLDQGGGPDAGSGQRPMVTAAARGDLDMVQLLLDRGALVHDPGRDDSRSPLAAASSQGHLACVQYLLDHGANPAKDPSALGQAIANGHVQVARLLIDRGADPKDGLGAVGSQSTPPLVAAARDGKLELVKLLVQCGADLNAKESSFGWTPLMIAADRGHVEVARHLVSAGADVQARANQGLTPLHAASQAGAIELVRLLIDQGADLEAKNDGGGTPLMDAAFHGQEAVLRELAARGGNVNAQNVHLMTPVMWASEKGHLGVAKALAELGADLDKRDKNHGKTALMGAAATGNVEMVRVLLDAGASKEVRDLQGDTVGAWIGGNRSAIMEELSRPRKKPVRVPAIDMRALIAKRGLRPLGNRERLTHTDDTYDVRLYLFANKEDAATYLRALESHGEGTPPPAAFEVLLVRIHTIYQEPFGLVLPYDRTDTREVFVAWLREALVACNETIRNYQPADHSTGQLHRYVKEVLDWTIVPPAGVSLIEGEVPTWLTDPPDQGRPALVSGG